MKAKEVEIRIQSFEDSMDKAINAISKVKKGRRVEPSKSLVFEDLNTLRKLLTDERIKLLKIIREKNPKNILMLSKLAKRKYPNVFSDIKLLENLGLIQLKRENNHLEPISKYDSLEIKIPV